MAFRSNPYQIATALLLQLPIPSMIATTKMLEMMAMAVLMLFGDHSLIYQQLWEMEHALPGGPGASNATLGRFSSCGELEAYLGENSRNGYAAYDGMIVPATAGSAVMAESVQKSMGEGGSSDYSTTNVQVEGVDEADIVKSDGKYLYVITGTKLVILDAYPADDAEVLSETETHLYSSEMFINGDKLVLFGQDYDSGYGETVARIYDISDREDPDVEKKLYVDGYYLDSRMIGEYVYLIANEPTYYYGYDYAIDNGGISVPQVRSAEGDAEPGSGSTASGCGGVYYFDEPFDSYSFTTVVTIDLDTNKVEDKVFLTGSAENMYVSAENIYIVHTRYPTYYYGGPVPMPMKAVGAVSGTPIRERAQEEQTVVHKLSIDGGEVDYVAKGRVPGHVLNQFSMDEYNGNFRIATTIGSVSRWGGGDAATNNVYVLDGELEIIGSVEDLAPGEQIYSARFMGERCYLVTFQKVDPLFVIDLSDPEDPAVLGKLKIPGYSDYLHPYDENHLIGIGKDAMPAEEGDFSWYQGVKVSLFDVSDVEHPKEIDNMEIGDRGTDSDALRDHKAFLFDREKNLLVLPILLAEIDEDQYPEGLPPYTYGDYTYQGAYVFSISPENGIKLRGRITHMDDDSEELLKSGYYFESQYSIKRSLYIGDVLYTISDMKVKMNSLDDLDELNELEISEPPEPPCRYYPEGGEYCGYPE